MLSILVVAIGQFKKTSILPQRLGMEFPGGRGGRCSARPQNLKKCMKLNWNSKRDGGGVDLENPFHGGGTSLDIFWNYTHNS